MNALCFARWNWPRRWIGCTLLIVFLMGEHIILAAEPAKGDHRDVFVASTGVDSAAGTKEAPVATLAQAKKLAYQGQPGSITIHVAGGTYRLDEPLIFTEIRSEIPFHQIVVQGEGDKPVVLSGGREITGWKEAGGAWQAELPEVREGKWWFEELYVGGVRRTRARHPNSGFARVAKAGPDARTSFFYRPEDIPAAPDIAQAEIVFLHDWSTSRVGVKQTDAAQHQLLFTDPIGPAPPHYKIDHFEPHPRYFLEGALSFLDAPGEWHLDRTTGVLSYRPLPGEVLAGFSAVAPRLENLITAQGDKDRPTLFVTLRNLTLAECGFNRPPNGYAGVQAGFYEDRSPKDASGKLHKTAPPAAVQIDHVLSCQVENCRIERVGGAGIWFRESCRGCTVVDSTIRDCGSNGLMIGETRSRPPDQTTADCRIENCLVEQCGQRFYGAVGIWLGLVRDCQVRNCEIRNLPYTGVSVGWQWNPQPTSCKNNEIRGNLIHDCMLILSDGGGIYTLGRQVGTKLAGNRIYNIPQAAGRAESNGMFLDEGSSEFTIESNTIYNVAQSPLRFHQAQNLSVSLNRLVARPGVPHYRYNSTDDKTIRRSLNTELSADAWQPPDSDPTAAAGVKRK